MRDLFKMWFMLIAAFISFESRCQGIKKMNINTFEIPIASIQSIKINFEDTVSDDTLFISRSSKGVPVFYFRKINTGVCIDNKCKILNIILYWTVTGRYLGFELSKDEFLSKSEHKKFCAEEYDQLHTILSDSYSTLAHFSKEELVYGNVSDIDAVTSATSTNIEDFVVEGAAYTTYALWCLIYGTSRKVIISRTLKELNCELLQLILNSPCVEDQAWGLSNIPKFLEFAPALQNMVFQFVKRTDDNFLVEKALEAIPITSLEIDTIQWKLLDCFVSADIDVKRLILRKLDDAPFLIKGLTKKLVAELPVNPFILVKDKLSLFSKLDNSNPEVIVQVTKLLNNKNSSISEQAFEFLRNSNISDHKIEQQIKLYRSKYNTVKNK